MSIKSAEPRKVVIRVGNGREKHIDRVEPISTDEVDENEVNNGEFEDDEVEKKDQKMSKSKKLFKSKKTVGSLDFFIPGARLVFTKLRQAFVKDSIFTTLILNIISKLR